MATTMMRTSTFSPSDREKRVRRGIKLLDKKVPDWLGRVKPTTLNIADCDDCILGQLFGKYINGAELLRLQPSFLVSEKDQTSATYYGFTGEYELTATWKRLIREKRAARRAKHVKQA